MHAQRDHRGHPFTIDRPLADEREADDFERYPDERDPADLEAEARSVTGCDGELRADGSGESTDGRTHAVRINEQLAMDDTEPDDTESKELPPIYVGDHVTDRDDEDGATMLVIGLPVADASEYEVKGQTVAKYNPDYPSDDDVIEVVYPQRTDVDVRDSQTYAFPRSRLVVEQPIHDVEGDEEVSA